MKDWIVLGSCLLALAVAFGAFGAHSLKSKISSEDLIIFETGVRYQIYHSIALILLGIIIFVLPTLKVNTIGYLFTFGILLFSGSLYVLVLTNLRWLGVITPIGGLCFIFGWILFAIKVFKS